MNQGLPKQVSEADAATESLLMSHINREADKRDFLSSFKKVILMHVQAIPLAPFGIKSAAATPAATTTVKNLETGVSTLSVQDASDISRSNTPGNPHRSSTPVPTTELAAKAALMNSRLEGIRSLFSLEIALKLLHDAKESLERAALFAKVEGQTGEEA